MSAKVAGSALMSVLHARSVTSIKRDKAGGINKGSALRKEFTKHGNKVISLQSICGITII